MILNRLQTTILSRRKPALAGVLLLCLASQPLAHELIGAGFAKTATQPLPVPFSTYATLSGGDRVVFDGQSIDLYDGQGNYLLNLGFLPSAVWTSFVVPDPTETFALVGESSNHDVFRVALDGSGMSTLANLNLNYDAAFEDANHAIISHSSCGFGCPNHLVRVDVTTGATTLVAVLEGPSGPVAVDESGDLYYGTTSNVFPTPPGSSDILTWTRAQTHGGTTLTETDATVFHAGLDGAVSLAIDPVVGNVFVAESVWGKESRILELDAATGDLLYTVVSSSNWLSKIELMRGGGIGHCHAYQPTDGVFLHYDNGSIATVTPQRPTATHTTTGGISTFEVQGASPFASMIVLWGPQSTYDPQEESYDIGLGFQFHTGIDLADLHRIPTPIAIGVDGTGAFRYPDNGKRKGTLVFQAFVTDVAGQIRGASEAALN